MSVKMEVGRRGQGRAIRGVVDEGLREEIRTLSAHLAVVEVGRHRDPKGGDDSEEENKTSTNGSEEEGIEIKLLKSVLMASSKPIQELSNYDGRFSTEALLDWISELDKYFEYEEISEDRKIKFVVTKLKGHATLWWDSVQVERRRLNKPLIKKWDRMIANMKRKFLPKDYQISLYIQVQNWRQRMMIVKEYTEEFYKVNLRDGYVEYTPEKTVRFVNGLWMEILDEISILSLRL